MIVDTIGIVKEHHTYFMNKDSDRSLVALMGDSLAIGDCRFRIVLPTKYSAGDKMLDRRFIFLKEKLID